MTQLHEELKSCGNPFIEDREELKSISRNCVTSPTSSPSLRNDLNIGLQAYDKFCEERLASGKHSIYGAISLNKHPLFRQANTLSTLKRIFRLSLLNTDCQVYASLYIVSQARQANLFMISDHKNHAYLV